MDAPLLTDDFREFLRLLNANRVESLLVAGRGMGAVRAFGFGLRELEASLFVDPRTLVRFGTPPFRIELMTSIDGVDFDGCAARAERFDLDGLTVPVIGLADLKANKRAAGRHKDLADLEYLP